MACAPTEFEGAEFELCFAMSTRRPCSISYPDPPVTFRRAVEQRDGLGTRLALTVSRARRMRSPCRPSVGSAHIILRCAAGLRDVGRVWRPRDPSLLGDRRNTEHVVVGADQRDGESHILFTMLRLAALSGAVPGLLARLDIGGESVRIVEPALTGFCVPQALTTAIWGVLKAKASYLEVRGLSDILLDKVNARVNQKCVHLSIHPSAGLPPTHSSIHLFLYSLNYLPIYVFMYWVTCLFSYSVILCFSSRLFIQFIYRLNWCILFIALLLLLWLWWVVVVAGSVRLHGAFLRRGPVRVACPHLGLSGTGRGAKATLRVFPGELRGRVRWPNG